MDIYTIELHSLRSLFGIVTQTPFIFSGTLRDNLAFGASLSEDDINKILNVSQLGLFIYKFDEIINC